MNPAKIPRDSTPESMALPHEGRNHRRGLPYSGGAITTVRTLHRIIRRLFPPHIEKRVPEDSTSGIPHVYVRKPW